jgi:hypothetical protein
MPIWPPGHDKQTFAVKKLGDGLRPKSAKETPPGAPDGLRLIGPG